MIRLSIIILGALGSAVMAVLDYRAVILVDNWMNWLPFIVSLLLVMISYAPTVLGEIFEGIGDALN